MAKKLNMNNPLFETTAEPEEVKPQAKKMGRPRKTDIVRDNSVQEGLTADLTRATFIMKVETLDALKDYAYTERITIKDAITDIIDGFIKDYKENPNNKLLSHKK